MVFLFVPIIHGQINYLWEIDAKIICIVFRLYRIDVRTTKKPQKIYHVEYQIRCEAKEITIINPMMYKLKIFYLHDNIVVAVAFYILQLKFKEIKLFQQQLC